MKKSKRYLALELAAMQAVELHQKFAHPAEPDHEGNTTCWFPESALRAALLLVEEEETPRKEGVMNMPKPSRVEGKEPQVRTREALIAAYIERQVNTAEGTEAAMKRVEDSYGPVDGWMLLECVMMGGSRLGEYVLLPYGPKCTFKEPPPYPISPRGLASDMSVVVAITRKEG